MDQSKALVAHKGSNSIYSHVFVFLSVRSLQLLGMSLLALCSHVVDSQG